MRRFSSGDFYCFLYRCHSAVSLVQEGVSGVSILAKLEDRSVEKNGMVTDQVTGFWVAICNDLSGNFRL